MSSETPVWWRNGVVYQVYPRSFRDANGDGTGDLLGVVEKLDYLQWLGVDAVWLSPFYPSPMADFGYDVSNYTDVDPLFGTLADFDRLVAEAHRRNVKVVVDYVPNHSSDQHPWFLDARSSRTSRYRDWYVWRDPKPDGSPPNNWLSVFGGPSWEWDERTGQYYLHSFLPEQPDLNWRNLALRQAMLDVLRFWLQRGVDGFRLDAVNRIAKHPDLLDNPPNERGGGEMHKPLGAYESQRHVYDIAHPDVHEYLRLIRSTVDELATPEQPRVTIGEIHVYDPVELSRYYGGALDELHLPFNFGMLKTPWQARTVAEHVLNYEAALPAGAWPNYVLSNHDEQRVATRVTPRFARLALLLLLTLRGTPTLYYGEELGMEDVPVPPERARDPWGARVPGLSLGRDPARTPMPWETTPNGGFCPPGVEPWLPTNADLERTSVAAQRDDPRSMLALARRLLALRRAQPALRAGTYRPLAGSGLPEDCLVFCREAGDDSLVVALNFSGADRALNLGTVKAAHLLLSTLLDREGAESPQRLTLRPAEGLVFRAG